MQVPSQSLGRADDDADSEAARGLTYRVRLEAAYVSENTRADKGMLCLQQSGQDADPLAGMMMLDQA